MSAPIAKDEPPAASAARLPNGRTMPADALSAQGYSPDPDDMPLSIPKWLWPLAWVESWTEWLDTKLNRWSLLNLIQKFAVLWIAVGAFLYVAGRKETDAARRKASHYAAWQVINSAQGKGGSGGRIDALQDLASDKVSLAGVQLDGAWLDSIRLPGAVLDDANLRGASLRGADLQNAKLANADLTGADLRSANLHHANLIGATLSGANLTDADLVDVNLFSADLQNASLVGADLRSAQLSVADLRGAALGAGPAPLVGMPQPPEIRNWRDIELMSRADISGVQYAPAGFRRWAVDTMNAIDSTAKGEE